MFLHIDTACVFFCFTVRFWWLCVISTSRTSFTVTWNLKTFSWLQLTLSHRCEVFVCFCQCQTECDVVSGGDHLSSFKTICVGSCSTEKYQNKLNKTRTQYYCLESKRQHFKQKFGLRWKWQIRKHVRNNRFFSEKLIG